MRLLGGDADAIEAAKHAAKAAIEAALHCSSHDSSALHTYDIG